MEECLAEWMFIRQENLSCQVYFFFFLFTQFSQLLTTHCPYLINARHAPMYFLSQQVVHLLTFGLSWTAQEARQRNMCNIYIILARLQSTYVYIHIYIYTHIYIYHMAKSSSFFSMLWPSGIGGVGWVFGFYFISILLSLPRHNKCISPHLTIHLSLPIISCLCKLQNKQNFSLLFACLGRNLEGCGAHTWLPLEAKFLYNQMVKFWLNFNQISLLNFPVALA